MSNEGKTEHLVALRVIALVCAGLFSADFGRYVYVP